MTPLASKPERIPQETLIGALARYSRFAFIMAIAKGKYLSNTEWDNLQSDGNYFIFYELNTHDPIKLGKDLGNDAFFLTKLGSSYGVARVMNFESEIEFFGWLLTISQ